MIILSKQYLFCIIASDQFKPQVWQGINLDYLHKDGVGLVISPLPSEATISGQDFPMLHFKLIETLMEQYTVLPVRFGTVLNSIEKAQDILAMRGEEFSRVLARVAGKVEMGLKALWDEKPEILPKEGAGSYTSGKNYLMARLVQHRAETLWQEKARSWGEQLNQRFSWAADHTTRYLITPRLFYHTAFLVSREDCNRFWEQVAVIKKDFPNLKTLASGPWPPYSFCSFSKEGENGKQDQCGSRGFGGIWR